LDIEGSGYDINSGYGIIQAFQAAGQVSTGTCDVPTNLATSSVFSTSVTVSWGAASGAVKYRLQYRQASVSTWTTVSNIAATSYTITGLTPNTNYKVRVQSTCAGTVKSAYSAIKSFASGIYCPIAGNTSLEYINTVKLGTINNTSGNNFGYGDYTSLMATLGAGTSKKIILTPGFTGTSYDEYWQVYIDYNHNGDFSDAGEMVAQGHGSAAINKTFVVPLTAVNGKTRMRIVMHFSSFLNQTCGTYADGEAEDYSVNITGGVAAVVASENSVTENTLNSILVSPNPVMGSSANLALQVSTAGTVNIKISDLSGRILRSETISGVTAGKNNYPLRNLNLFPGIYMIVAEQNSAIIARTQFIVDK
jgi:hypothetical protein